MLIVYSFDFCQFFIVFLLNQSKYYKNSTFFSSSDNAFHLASKDAFDEAVPLTPEDLIRLQYKSNAMITK